MLINSQVHNVQFPKPNMWAHSLASVLFLGVVALGVGSSACAKARAATVPDGPPLQVPEAPPRVLVPIEEATVAAPAPEPPPPAPVRTPPRPAPEPRSQPAPPAAAQAPPQPAPPERELRAAPSSTTVTERSVRDLLARATRDLNRVDYGRLSADGRATYDQSKRFGQQAEQALRERNVVFAATLADKAATLAAELFKR